MQNKVYLFIVLAAGSSSALGASTLLCKRALDPAAVKASIHPSPEETAFLQTLDLPAVFKGPPESEAITRVGFPFKSSTRLRSEAIVLPNGDHGLRLSHEGPLQNYGGIEYREMTNMPLMTIHNPKTGEAQVLMLPRSIRNYHTEVNLTAGGTISPQEYVSDVQAFVWTPKFGKNGKLSGKIKHVGAVVTSQPDIGFIFEDPRLSVIYNPDGTSRTFLSGTDYSSHVVGKKDPDVMNRYVELQFDENGLPLAADRNGKIKFHDLSPPPALREGGGHTYIDAKNAVITRNEAGEIVVRTRFRPDFKDPEIQKIARGRSWKYAEQVLVFPSIEAMQAYDWKYALEDLFDSKMASGPRDRVRPRIARSILEDKDLVELFDASDVIAEKGKGLGPGSAPYRVERRGDRLFISRGKNAPAYPEPETLPPGFPMKDGEITYIAFDHEVRYLRDVRMGKKFTKRHYSVSAVEFTTDLTEIKTYYSDVLQPKDALELNSGSSGIADLQHLYPMPGDVIPDAQGHAITLQPLGSSDASVEMTKISFTRLIPEMHSPSRIASRQVRRTAHHH